MRFLVLATIVISAHAAVADRVAVVVGNNVITESEVDEEVRVTEFLNQQPPDVSRKEKLAAADRLVDQQLIRNEMQIGGYEAPPESEADTLLANFRRQHYPSESAFRAALGKYGLREQELKQHLLWQVAVLRFTQQRFQPGIPGPPVQTASRYRAGAAPAPANTVDQQMDAWLRQTREQTKVQYKQEAFQ